MKKKITTEKITAEEFDRLFDEGKTDMTPYLDMSSVRRPGVEQKRVNVDFPAWMVRSIDKEATRMGVTRQALIKFWLADKLQHMQQ